MNPTVAELEKIYRDYTDIETETRSSGDGQPEEVADMLSARGFTVTIREYPHDLHYSAQQWVDIAFTFSNQLLVAQDRAPELRSRLVERIGPAGVVVGGDAVAIFASPT